MMRRRALIFLLAVGTFAGYASGFASLYRWHHYGPGGFCRHEQSYGYGNPGPSTAPWAPPQTPQAPRPAEAPPAPPAQQAQAPTPDTPATPGPR
ncbi:hypothetical protein [Vitiosangium sp. GDMCC 1.1324]|uniref:hypothetical protein n=1 Tax=Vitiosangium sp. (strain GDMCC 1.1324) TaxID=2138576 RepID=UPI000D35BD45|nr:hypothetical protein [Vitiosangium sp. GDMCC 1.1324]PTL78670.1 hypothetical protein DAT35_36985 [Vitiosangium sp. GDMCC 1.1324]